MIVIYLILLVFFFFFNCVFGPSLVIWWFRHCLSMQGLQFHSLVRKLRLPHAARPKNQNIKQKQCCNRFNQDFLKNGSLKKSFEKLKNKISMFAITNSSAMHLYMISCEHVVVCQKGEHVAVER